MARSGPTSECVRVAVRCRPLSERERAEGQRGAVAVDAAAAQVTLRSAPLRAAGEAPRAFTFDCAFGPEASQAEVYDAMAAPLVESALAGYNATLFAFGQTGTGKVGRPLRGLGCRVCLFAAALPGRCTPSPLRADAHDGGCHRRRQPRRRA